MPHRFALGLALLAAAAPATAQWLDYDLKHFPSSAADDGFRGFAPLLYDVDGLINRRLPASMLLDYKIDEIAAFEATVGEKPGYDPLPYDFDRLVALDRVIGRIAAAD